MVALKDGRKRRLINFLSSATRHNPLLFLAISKKPKIPSFQRDSKRRAPQDTEMGNQFTRAFCVGRRSRESDVEELYASPPGKVGFQRPFTLPALDLAFLTGKDEGASGCLHVLHRKVGDARRIVLESMRSKPGLELEAVLHEVFAPLTGDEENTVSWAFKGGKSSEILVIHEGSNIEITRGVLQCLRRGGWLNDEVINLYLELLKEREKREPEGFLKCHFFNSFFYNKLTSGGNEYDFRAVRRWTSQKKLGYGLIDCEKIFVPIHKGDHWCLAVVNVMEESFQYLDSLGGMDCDVLNILARYFMDEVMDKSGRQIDNKRWKQETVNNLPLQKNGWDCGMFMLKYVDFYSRGLSLCFSQENMMYFRKRTAKEILLLRAE